MLKKVFTGILMMIMVMVMSLPVMAGTLEETRVKYKVSEIEYDMYEFMSDEDTSEGVRRGIEPSVKAYSLGNGVYDIVTSIKVYKKYVYEIHELYDSIEDEDLVRYGMYEGKRYTDDDLGELLENRHPEFFR
jgi:hypothetical protein